MVSFVSGESITCYLCDSNNSLQCADSWQAVGVNSVECSINDLSKIERLSVEVRLLERELKNKEAHIEYACLAFGLSGEVGRLLITCIKKLI